MPINQYIDDFFNDTQSSPVGKFHAPLKINIKKYFESRKHGHQQEWDDVLQNLPALTTAHFRLDAGCIEIGKAAELSSSLEPLLQDLHPWRKGPFNFFGTLVDSEWRSDWKWQRIQPHIASLKDRNVLDIGCGNGYHLFRMLGDGASLALGIDPSRLFLYQFHLTKSFLPSTAAYLLPLRSEHLPEFECFDTVFSLGVLYHRRSPMDHLAELLSFIRPGGELVLETLVVEGDRQTVLMPKERYAKMANVWFLPSTQVLEIWLHRAGFDNIRLVDVTQTSVQEQRSTNWMKFQSLSDFLSPINAGQTIEGLPAPRRAIIVAEKH